MKRYEIQDKRLDRCISIALTQKRFIRSSLKETLYKKCLYVDLNQELLAAGVEAWRLGYDPDCDFKKIRNLTQRRLYAWLKNNGIHRHWDPKTKKQGKGFLSREAYLPEHKEPTSNLVDASEFMLWCELIIISRFGREAWQEVMQWANSRQPEPQGKVRQIISILKEELA